ncbi:DNA replication/repair protein RecF [[Clostridium] polysaccharolyticum]|uniref:DNA replication and repair protein RecF n=1 Tax=[Clostridium] polysaccharolyticum TaxID=29364 RepID=A0A1I0F218_9FIRM|nr:DNA replication/repair protein RecF [[Clostridium] polysaccharolyticum]SET51668.1 DNA replication and repair protein RecF [[Clostridium] polysaccharolyticum]
MFVKSLELCNFRNYTDLNIEFSSGVNILYGDNAQGKTNILEAIYIGGTTKSHKGSKDKELIMMEKPEAHIRLLVDRKGFTHKVDMHLKRNKSKGIAIDGIPIKKSSELIGLAHMVFFSPEDLSIIKNGPGERRRFIDMELCQLDKLYLHNLIKYNKVLNQRNHLLKQIGLNQNLMDTLSVWDAQLVEYGKMIVRRRNEFVNQLNEIIFDIHKKLSGNKEELFIEYVPNISSDMFETKLIQARSKDVITKNTSVGPHRDDIQFLIKGIDLRKFGSQGQQRTAALSVKLAEIEMVKKIIGERPVLLLDDVLSELDRNRQNYLLDSIKDIQTIVTCTGLEEFVNNRMIMDQIYEVVNGTVLNKK